VKQGEEKQTDFITVVAWQQRAEFICKYFSKGQKIALTGSIRTGSYTDSEGNKRNTFEVWAENVEFCESRATQTQPHNQQQQKKETVSDVSMEYDMNADLPF
jgi:single-strand DNA-binding protein